MNYFEKIAAEPAAQNSLWKIFEQSRQPNLYGKGQMIYLQGELAEQFYYLKSGKVIIFLSSESGTEKTLTVLEHGNIFGEAAFFDGLPRVSSAKALDKSEIIPVSQSIFMECVAKEPELAMNLLCYLSRTVRMLSAQVDHMTFLQADQRIAQLLLHMSLSNRTIPCTHEELGNLVGASRVTVSRILNRFAKNGWISTQYRIITVCDQNALSSFAFQNREK